MSTHFLARATSVRRPNFVSSTIETTSHGAYFALMFILIIRCPLKTASRIAEVFGHLSRYGTGMPNAGVGCIRKE